MYLQLPCGSNIASYPFKMCQKLLHDIAQKQLCTLFKNVFTLINGLKYVMCFFVARSIVQDWFAYVNALPVINNVIVSSQSAEVDAG